MTATLLLIGGSSPLGRAITTAMAGDDMTVVSTSRSGAGIRLDVRDRAAVDGLVASVRPTSVVYLASPKPAELAADDGLLAQMVRAFEHTVRRCAGAGVTSFVFASSAAVYGTAHAAPRREDDPAEGDSGHARLKLACEGILHETGGETMTTTSLRYFNLFGPGFGDSLINRLASTREKPPLQISERFVRDYVHAVAAGAATAAALRRPLGSPARIFNVGTGRGTDNVRLSRLAAPDAYAPAPAGPPSYSVADTTRAERELGVRPEDVVAEALTDPGGFGIADD